MAFIEESDMTTHISAQSIAAIKAGDTTKLTKAITSAQVLAASYLGRYDTETIFAADTEDKDTIYSDLIDQIKHVAKWKFIQNSNAGIDMELAHMNYKDALKALERYGQQLQDAWPPAEEEEADKIMRAGSRLKFDHYGFSEVVDPDDPFTT